MNEQMTKKDWESKQVLDLASKAVNSVLMHEGVAWADEGVQRSLAGLAINLTKVYTKILKDLQE